MKRPAISFETIAGRYTMELLPNVHYLAGQANIYLCVAETSLALVDTGMPGRLDPIFDYIRNLGRRPSELSHILITHADIDHAGKAARLQSETGAAVHAGMATAGYLDKAQSPKHLPRPLQFLADHLFRFRPVPAETIDIFEDGDELPILGGLQVIATPGHTPDHHSFYSPSLGILFAGDALRTSRDRVRIGPRLLTADRRAAARSALRLLELSPAVIAGGHGRPLFSHTSDELDRLTTSLRHHL